MHGGGTDLAPDCKLWCQMLRSRLEGLRTRVEPEPMLEQWNWIFWLHRLRLNAIAKSAPPWRAFSAAPTGAAGGAAAGALPKGL